MSTPLYGFAHFPAARDAKKFEKLRLGELIKRLKLNNPEDLKFVDDADPNPRPFTQLIGHIFRSFEHKRKLKYSPDRKYVVFDPSFSVVDKPDMHIYMLFGKNPNGIQDWSFRGWCVSWDDVLNSTKRFDAPECIICMEKPRNAMLVHGNTGHFICCLACAQRFDKCPLCSIPIDNVIQCWM